ncbi:hypothetical protein [Nostoc sp.]
MNIDELEAITTGSHLGEAVKLIKNLKNNLNLAIHELEKQEDTISNELPDSEISTQPSHEKTNKNENTKKIIVDYLTSVVSGDAGIIS